MQKNLSRLRFHSTETASLVQTGIASDRVSGKMILNNHVVGGDSRFWMGVVSSTLLQISTSPANIERVVYCNTLNSKVPKD